MRLAQLLSFYENAKRPDHKKLNDYEWRVSGMKWKELKHHYAVIPIHLMAIGAMIMAGCYVYRLASKHPEVAWTKMNPEPWNEYRCKQYKFLDSGRDYTEGSWAPRYK